MVKNFLSLQIVKKNNTLFYINSYTIGLLSEFLIIIFLIFKGYKIIRWRYKTKLGEIDIIASKRKILYIIEVKYRKHNIRLDNLIRPNQIRRIKHAYLLFNNLKKYQNYEVNFDLITVEKRAKITHYKRYLQDVN